MHYCTGAGVNYYVYSYVYSVCHIIISQKEAEGITFPDAREHTSTGIQVVIDDDSSFSFESVL